MRSVITLTTLFLLVASPTLAQVLNPMDERQPFSVMEITSPEMPDAHLEDGQYVIRLADGSYATPSRGEGPELVLAEYCGKTEDAFLVFCPVSTFDFGTVATGGLGPFPTSRFYDGEGNRLPHMRLFNLSETDAATNPSVEIDPEPQFQGLYPTFTNTGGCQEVEQVHPGNSCRVYVRFAPTEVGPVEGTLTISSAEGAEASVTLHGTGGEDVLLHGQFYQWDTFPGSPYFIGYPNGRYLTTPAYDSEMADDFLVEDPDGWTITTVGLGTLSQSMWLGSIPLFDVYIAPDDNGYPAEEAICSAPGSQLVWSDGYEMRAEIVLPEPCVLPPGHYWFAAQPVLTHFGFERADWAVHVPLIEPPEGGWVDHLHKQVWRNPGGWFFDGACTEWAYMYFGPCAPVEPFGAIFWLIGQEGKIITNEPFAEAHTGVLTAPSPNPVRERATFELTVDRGQQVTVEVFDLMGRRVQVLYDGSLAAGITENLSFDASRLPSGVYVIRALGEDFVDTRRVTVVR